jgi:hypothetical protein
MSASPISPQVLSLLGKISQLTAEEVYEVEHFIEFLLTKKERSLHYSDMIPDSTQDTSHTNTISEFIASFTAPPISQADISQEYSDSFPSDFSRDFSEKEKEQNKISIIKQMGDKESTHVIIAPEEPICENSPNEIDFADINARFAKKREEQNKEKPKKSKLKELDWL